MEERTIGSTEVTVLSIENLDRSLRAESAKYLI
jgi:hypothetical protein